MIKNLQDTTTLNNGVKMPWFGLGVYKVADGEEVKFAVNTAIQAGYRSIDTAAFYQNERGVGKELKKMSVPREEIFITTKVWNDSQGYDDTIQAFNKSMQNLDVDYLDLYLIHWPMKGKYKDTWKALETLYKEGKVRAIGVSNFKEHHLEDLLETAEIVPAVNQVELHPQLTQKNLRNYCKQHHIQIEAWSPLMRGKILNDPVLTKIANKHQKNTAQIILRWNLQNEIVTIPKSTNKDRIVENADIFDFALTDDDLARIDALNQDKRVGTNPDVFG